MSTSHLLPSSYLNGVKYPHGMSPRVVEAGYEGQSAGGGQAAGQKEGQGPAGSIPKTGHSSGIGTNPLEVSLYLRL